MTGVVAAILGVLALGLAIDGRRQLEREREARQFGDDNAHRNLEEIVSDVARRADLLNGQLDTLRADVRTLRGSLHAHTHKGPRDAHERRGGDRARRRRHVCPGCGRAAGSGAWESAKEVPTHPRGAQLRHIGHAEDGCGYVDRRRVFNRRGLGHNWRGPGDGGDT